MRPQNRLNKHRRYHMTQKKETQNAVMQVQALILTLRGGRVMLDSDLAASYGVSTAHLNQQVGRNRNRFPNDFCFQLTTQEWEEHQAAVRLQNATLNNRRVNESRKANVQAPFLR